MEEFKSTLKRRMKIHIMLVVVFAIVMVVSTWLCFGLETEFSSTTNTMLGFQTGLCTSWMVMMLIGIWKIAQAMKDEKKCKMMYIEEHDERQKMIQLKTGRTAVVIGLCVMILAVYVSGFFSEIVFTTLIVVLTCFSLLVVGVKIYYNKTM